MELFALTMIGMVFGACCLVGISLCCAVHQAKMEHRRLIDSHQHRKLENSTSEGRKVRIRKVTLAEAIYELLKRVRIRPYSRDSKGDSTECQSAVISLESISLVDLDQTLAEIAKDPQTQL